MIRRTIKWFFGRQDEPLEWWQVILWWEVRRIPYNLLVGFYGLACLIIFYWGVENSGFVEPPEDAIDPPILLFALPVLVNLGYTLGWVVELPAVFVSPSKRLGPFLLMCGVVFSLFIISVPAFFWGGYHVLQLLHVVD